MKTIPSNRYLSMPVILVFCCICAVLFTNSVSSEGPKNIRGGTVKEAIRMFDVGFGGRKFSFQLGRETESRYLGSPALQQAVQSQAQPKSMISDDFNGDGMGDLVIGYANNGAGLLGMRQGNLQAIAPTDPSVFQAITQGRYPSPFLPEVTLHQLPEAPDFLQFGDFNSDGYADVMTAARGGQKMYLLAGDGHGNLGAAESIDVPGLITEMRAATQQLGTFTQLAVGLSAPGEARLAIYNDTKALVNGAENYPMTGEVTALAFDQLDGDGITDLAAATSSEVVVIHGRISNLIESANSDAKSSLESTAAKSALIERQNFPFAIRGLATGDFAFDRNHQREIAVLSDDGTVYLSARGTPDTRPFTPQEKQNISQLRRSFAQDKIDMETLTAEINKLIQPNRAAGWNVSETIPGTSAYTGTGKALFQRSSATSLPIDDLLIGDGINNRVQVVRNERDAEKLKIESTPSREVSVAGTPIAAVSMRLGVNVEPGMVLLGSDQVEPTVVILAPNAVFTVNSTADLPDVTPTAANGVCLASNGLCTLRAAVMQSSHTGGSNTIMVPDGTYTLILGPPDDEFNTGGAIEESGDLDIFSWDGFDGSPILTAVGITGGTRDGCIIQMGVLSPTLATNVPNNKERILEVNDVAVIGFHRRIAVTLTNLTMQNGFSPTGSGNFLEGGAIYYDGSAQDNTNIGLLTLTNVKLSANTSAGQGGGVWAGFGSLTINSTSIVRANTATNQSTGGAAWTGGNTVETQALNIANSTIGGALVADGNQATDPTFGAPGGVDARGGLSVTISGTTIQNNIANVTGPTIGGGGIQINSPTVAISTSTISDNKSKGNAGGIYSSARNAVTNAPSTLTLTTVNVTGNQADSDNTLAGDGGGIYNFFGTAIIQTTSHVDGNSAFNGGGIFNAWTGIPADATAGLTVQTSSTIGQAGAGNGNSAKNNGGSIAISQAGASIFGPITLNTLTFTNNTANSDSAGGGDGGAIFISAGTITSLNTCTFDSNVANSGTGDGIRQTGGTITGAGTLNFNGGDSISITGGTFNSTPATLNLTGNLLKVGGAFAATGGTVNCNGSAAQTIGSDAMTFNNLTINNAAGVTLTGNETVAGTLTLTSGVLSIGTTTLTLTGPVSFTSGTIGSSPTGTVNYNQVAGGQNVAPGNYGNLAFNNSAKVLPNGPTVGIAGTFTPGAGVPTITGSTVDFNGALAQTIPVFNYNNLTSSNVGARTLAAGIIGVAGTFTPGTNAYTITGNTMNFNGAGAQTIPAFNYNNLTSSNAGARTLANASTIGIAGVFTPGTNGYTITGSTIDFNGAGAQTIPAFNYNNLTSSNVGARTLANAGTIGIAGVFTPGANAYTITGSTINFNGAGAQTIPAFNYNNLTSSNAGARTLANAGTIGVAGAFTPGTNAYTITDSTIDFNGAGAQTIPAFNYNNLTSSNTGGRTLENAGTIGIAGVFTPGTNAYTITGSTINFNGAGAQSIPGFNYNNLTSSGGGAPRTLDAVNPIRIAGVFTPGTDIYTVTGSTIEYNGGAVQSLPATFTPYNNLTFNNPTTVTGGPAALDVNGNLTITQGTFAAGTSLVITVAGNWTNNGGTFNAGSGIVTFDGGVGQAIGGTTATTFNNLTTGNASGIAMNNDNTVNGILALTNGDITVAATRTLTQPLAGSSTGTFDVNGRVQRNGFVTGGAALSFGNPFNTIQVTADVAPANIVVDLARSVPVGVMGYPTAVARTYTITPSAAGFTGTLRLHYLDSELNGNTEGPGLNLWSFTGIGWQPFVITSSDTTANWVEKTGITTFSPWTMNSSNAPTASGGVITGRIVDDQGNPVEGAVVRLSGTQNRKFITDANGFYRFDNVETNGFYTVTPSRANYSFNPAERSFSQVGQTTEATFAATVASSGLVNPLDTPEYFVRQHYVDFLNREPDEAGFNFWSDQIIECGSDQNCIGRRKENVSAAYFLSIEFQQTGGLVDGLYRVAYGVRPEFSQFMPDARIVGQGVQVNKDGWQALLEANKEAFVAAFVNRTAFHQMYDSMDNSLYVDTLIGHTGVSFTSAERDALVSALGAGSMTRAQALRSIAENGRFVSAKFNDTFVMMEYMGYLRRDADPAGFAFWLNKLNQFNGNFEQAEMVKAFIVSGEYRDRFPR